jgi:hypothetical protein
VYRIIAALILLLTVTTARVEGQAPNQPPPDFRFSPEVQRGMDKLAADNASVDWQKRSKELEESRTSSQIWRWVGYGVIALLSSIAAARAASKGKVWPSVVTPSGGLPAQPPAGQSTYSRHHIYYDTVFSYWPSVPAQAPPQGTPSGNDIAVEGAPPATAQPSESPEEQPGTQGDTATGA